MDNSFLDPDQLFCDTQIQLSLCLADIQQQKKIEDFYTCFEKSVVSADSFKQSPNEILNDKNLVVKIDNFLFGSANGLEVLKQQLLLNQGPTEEQINKSLNHQAKDFKISSEDLTFLVPTSSQLKIIKGYLNYGKNTIKFQVKDKKDFIEGNIYYWKHTEKIIISDVDGTVTKSDILGHLLPRLGASDWAHQGIASLYNNIFQNGYKIVYLSSRPVGYSEATKKYLNKIKQDGISMPEGPLLLSPDRSMASLWREMVIKQPHIFKIGCLQTIKNLFPINTEPFACGFGNRETDTISYLAVNIKPQNIFIVNPKGEILQ